jgi:formylmethanofuran dehydrogenase subunit C
VSAVRLVLRTAPSVLLEAPCVRPDAFAACTQAEIAALPVWHGKDAARLGDFFDVQGGGSDEVRVTGDVSRVRRLGEGMAGGRLIVEGRAGLHTGSGMRGGELRVEGDADDFCGAEMQGGVLEIRGDAGAELGGAYAGSSRGMTGGVVLVHGSVGESVGGRMRRGLIAVSGEAGRYAGCHMIAGTVVVLGSVGRGAGLGMKRGTIVVGGALELLPTFRYACTDAPAFLGVLFRALKAQGFGAERRLESGVFRRYRGDFTELGRGEILQWASEQPTAH